MPLNPGFCSVDRRIVKELEGFLPGAEASSCRRVFTNSAGYLGVYSVFACMRLKERPLTVTKVSEAPARPPAIMLATTEEDPLSMFGSLTEEFDGKVKNKSICRVLL